MSVRRTGYPLVMTTTPENTPDPDATPEARALHGDQAAAEQYPQPEAVTLPADTRIATEDPDQGDDER